MKTKDVVKEKKRKIIDLDEKTFKTLSIKAASMGTNLKVLIEDYLRNIADDLNESNQYTYLVQTRPEGKVMLDEQEQKDFEIWLGITQ